MLKKTVFVFVVVFAQIFLFCDASIFAENPEIRVTMKGKISNIADVGQYINAQTLLQLYPCETSDRIDLQRSKKGLPEATPAQKNKVYHMDPQGRLVPHSTLPAIGLPVFGDFNFFRVRGLVPGKCYKICVTHLDNPCPGMVPLTGNDGKPFEIILPEPKAADNELKITIDLTEQPLRIPEL